MEGYHTFKNNYAQEAGGGMTWTMLEPNFTNSINFQNNSALLYGNDISCFAQNLITLTYSEYLSYLNKTNSTSKRLSESKTSQLLSGIRSGGELQDIYLAIVDKYGVIVGNDNKSKVTLRVNSKYNQNNAAANEFSPLLEGNN